MRIEDVLLEGGMVLALEMVSLFLGPFVSELSTTLVGSRLALFGV